ncbi:hypothetical protein [Dickeya chrysanthemi]|uniref:hypothetical protein n=1 Tax=Dickeya chrysanthemi TaxID=556 RepID=UPI00301A1B69
MATIVLMGKSVLMGESVLLSESTPYVFGMTAVLPRNTHRTANQRNGKEGTS